MRASLDQVHGDFVAPGDNDLAYSGTWVELGLN
jgi:hypothetical protein